jgi:sn-glycerol 3-phosphate transport system substrate-binding protein
VPFLTKENGFGGPDAKLVFNGPVQVKHIENMQDWIKKGYFIYGGRKNEPEAKFYSGECAMMTTSSAAYATIKQQAKFKFAESTLPYYGDVQGAPQNTIIGGASLWIMGGKSKDEYKASPNSSRSCRSPRSRPNSRRRPVTCRSRWPRTS